MEREDRPAEDDDFILERVFFALERLLVDDLDGAHFGGFLFVLGETHLRKCPPETEQ